MLPSVLYTIPLQTKDSDDQLEGKRRWNERTRCGFRKWSYTAAPLPCPPVKVWTYKNGMCLLMINQTFCTKGQKNIWVFHASSAGWELKTGQPKKKNARELVLIETKSSLRIPSDLDKLLPIIFYVATANPLTLISLIWPSYLVAQQWNPVIVTFACSCSPTCAMARTTPFAMYLEVF